MSQHNVTIVDMEGLVELLDEIFSEEGTVSKDEAFNRFKR